MTKTNTTLSDAEAAYAAALCYARAAFALYADATATDVAAAYAEYVRAAAYAASVKPQEITE